MPATPSSATPSKALGLYLVLIYLAAMSLCCLVVLLVAGRRRAVVPDAGVRMAETSP